MYQIFLTDECQKSLEKITKNGRLFIEQKIKEYIIPQLKDEPHYGINIKKLHNYSPETWRYRIGKFRLFYLINEKDKIVSLLTVSYRKDAY